jgi:hypothetical protein
MYAISKLCVTSTELTDIACTVISKLCVTSTKLSATKTAHALHYALVYSFEHMFAVNDHKLTDRTQGHGQE